MNGEVHEMIIKAIKEKIEGFIKGQCGQAMVLFALSLPVILGMTGLFMDTGLMVLEKERLQRACDAAAIAGAYELPDEENARERAAEYFQINGYSAENLTVFVVPEQNKITVEGKKKVNLTFMKVMGFNDVEVKAKASAVYGAVNGITGVVPFGIPDQYLEYGRLYTLKAAPKDQYGPGNYGALALGFRGSANYENNLKYGYSGFLRVGDWVETEPGNMSGPTERGVNYRLNACPHSPQCSIENYHPGCPRIMIVPVFDPSSLMQGRDEVRIVGFAAFLIKGISGSGSESEVTGYFLKIIPPDGSYFTIIGSQQNYGLHAAKLVE